MQSVYLTWMISALGLGRHPSSCVQTAVGEALTSAFC